MLLFIILPLSLRAPLGVGQSVSLSPVIARSAATRQSVSHTPRAIFCCSARHLHTMVGDSFVLCSGCKAQNCFPDRGQCVMTYLILPMKEVLKWQITQEAPALHGKWLPSSCAFCYPEREGHPNRKADKKVRRFFANSMLS